jgi:hypothetical protein
MLELPLPIHDKKSEKASEIFMMDTAKDPDDVKYIYSCPKPIVSSTAVVNLDCSTSKFLYGGRSRRLKL